MMKNKDKEILNILKSNIKLQYVYSDSMVNRSIILVINSDTNPDIFDKIYNWKYKNEKNK